MSVRGAARQTRIQNVYIEVKDKSRRASSWGPVKVTLSGPTEDLEKIKFSFDVHAVHACCSEIGKQYEDNSKWI